MGAAARVPAGLPGFRERLTAGIYQSASRERQADYAERDDRALESWPPDGELGALSRIHGEEWHRTGDPSPVIARLAEAMAGRRVLLEAVIFAPDKALDRLLAACRGPGSELVDTWVAMCWTVEAAWRVVTGPGGADLAAEDLAVLRPVAARLRFLVLSEPMRWRGTGREPRPGAALAWWDFPPDRQLGGGSGVLGAVLGPKSWEKLVDRCREARAEWKDCLDNYQAHRLLRRARPADLEADLLLILFRDDAWSRPLGLSGNVLAAPAKLTFEDHEVIEDAVEQHLLPRFAVGAVARLMLDDDSAGLRAVRYALAALVVAAAVCAVALAAQRQVYLALLPAAACYGLICLGMLVLPQNWGLMWLLRMPAAAAVGVIALDSFMPGGWLSSFRPGTWKDGVPAGWAGAHGWEAVAALGIASFGYLLIEVRNHGASPPQALGRALAVTVIGAMHALMVSLIGLVVIAPAFVGSGLQLHDMWAHLAPHQAIAILSLATAWCLAFGVFTQILWDDQPITASLAHIRWRREK